MPTIKIDVHNKLARCADKRAFAVCGNNDYTISFNFDSEWDDYPAKTARFAYNGKYQDVVFTGTECAMPALYGVNSVFIGVYAGDIRTTAPAQLLMVRSIMDGKPKHDEPTADVYNQILALMEAGKIKGDKGTDGFSPTVSVTETDEGTTVTFTDKDGEKVANIKNGKQGDKGDTGATGPAIRIVNYSPIGTTPKDLIADGLDLDFYEYTQAPIVGETVIILWKTLVMDSDESHTYLVYSEIDSIGDDMWGHLSFSQPNIYDITGEDGSDGLPALVCNSAYSSPTYKTLKIGASCQLHAHDFSRNAAVGDVFHLVWKDTGTDRTYIVTAQVISIQEGYVNGKVLSFADITGKDGADGFSPTATVTQTSTGADVSITDKNGTTNAHIENGSDANVTKENVVSALGYTPLESAPVTSVNGKVGAVELAASDVGAISSADGSVQNAHLADSSVTTDKLAEAERMTSANITNALGYEPEKVSGEWELIETITLTEDTAAIERTQEPDGTAYNFKGIWVFYQGLTSSVIMVFLNGSSEYISTIVNNLENAMYWANGKYVIRGGLIEVTTGGRGYLAANYGQGSRFNPAWVATYAGGKPTVEKLRLTGTFTSGFKIFIYGIRA